MSIAFEVYGTPKGQPRVKAFSRGKHAAVYDPGTADDWKTLVAIEARKHIPAERMQGPVECSIMYRFPRPRSHYGTGSKSSELKPMAPACHTGKPDLDNLDKAILDVLTNLGFWHDDSQVCAVKCWKMYENSAYRPGAYIVLDNLDTIGPPPAEFECLPAHKENP